MLRTFGTELCAQATWSGAAILLACLSLLGEPNPQTVIRHSVCIALLLTSLVGFAQATISLASDQLLGSGHSWSDAGRSWMLFVVVWTPACLGLASQRPPGRRTAADLVLRTLPVVLSLTMATDWRDGLSLGPCVANALITLGVILAMARCSRSSAVETPCA